MGAHTKYLDTYKVMGNHKIEGLIAKRYSQFKDRGYEANVGYINQALVGWYEQDYEPLRYDDI